MSDTYARLTVSVKRGEATVKGEVPAPVFSRCEELALRELGENLSAPGFRKGHLPLEMLRRELDEKHVLELAAHKALEAAYRDIVRDNKLRPITPPQVTVTHIARGNPLGFSLRIGLYPRVKLPDYKQLAAKVKEREALVQELLKHAKVELPDLVLDLEIHRMRESLGDHLKKMNTSEEAFFKEERERIARDLKRQIIMEAIAEAEHLMPDDKSVAAFTARLHEHHPGAPRGRLAEHVRLLLRDEAVFHLLLGEPPIATAGTGPDKR